MASNDAIPIAHGYTVADIARLGRTAAKLARNGVVQGGDRIDAASYAITVALLEASEKPNGAELLTAGIHAINEAGRHEQRHHGMDERDPFRQRRAWGTYWHGERQLVAPWEEGVVESLALKQIWPMLTATEQRVLRTLAAYDEYPGSVAAAIDAGMKQSTFTSNLSNARIKFRYWWHQHEEPSPMWGQDRKGSHGNVIAQRRRTLARGREQGAT